MRIIQVFDNKGKTLDRYTIVFSNKGYNRLAQTGQYLYPCLSVSKKLEVSQFGDCELGEDNEFLGEKIKFTDLPEEVQKHVKERMKE